MVTKTSGVKRKLIFSNLSDKKLKNNNYLTTAWFVLKIIFNLSILLASLITIGIFMQHYAKASSL